MVLCGSVPSASADHSVFAHLSTGPAGGNGPVHLQTDFKVTPDGEHVFFQTWEQLTFDDTDNGQDIYRRSGPR